MNQNLDHKKFRFHVCIYFTWTRTLSRSKFRSMHVSTYQLYILKLNFRFKDPFIHLMYQEKNNFKTFSKIYILKFSIWKPDSDTSIKFWDLMHAYVF